MNLVNAVISLDPTSLSKSLRKIEARHLHSIVVAFVRVPDDVTAITLRILRTTDTFVDIPASRRPDGSAICHVIGTVFDSVGAMRYEVHAFDAWGNSTALGSGDVTVGPFSASGTPLAPGEERLIQTIADRDGNLHSIFAVQDSTGNYTLVIDQD